MATTIPNLVGTLARRLPVLAAGLAALACATPYAKLDGVLAGTRPAPANGPGPVTVVHEGSSAPGSPQQSIVKGDSMRTSPDGVAVLTLRPGYEVIVSPGSEIYIENPSIFVRFGKLFLKKLKQTREALRLNTQFVSAGVEGTEFVFEVSRDDVVRLTVLEGAVMLRPQNGAWAAVTYRTGETVVIRGAAPPGRIQPLDPATTRAIRQQNIAIEQSVRYRTGQPWSRFTALWKRPILFVPAIAIGAGTAILVARGGGSHDGIVTIHIPF
jgi:hypothetical protein